MRPPKFLLYIFDYKFLTSPLELSADVGHRVKLQAFDNEWAVLQGKHCTTPNMIQSSRKRYAFNKDRLNNQQSW